MKYTDTLDDMMDRAHYAEICEELLRIEVDRLEAENTRLAAALDEARADCNHLMLALVQSDEAIAMADGLVLESLSEDGPDIGFDERMDAYEEKKKQMSDWRSRDLKLGEVEKLKADNERLRKALRSISTGAKRYWREGDDAYQFAILADAALSAVPSSSPPQEKLSVINEGTLKKNLNPPPTSPRPAPPKAQVAPPDAAQQSNLSDIKVWCSIHGQSTGPVCFKCQSAPDVKTAPQ